MVWILSIYVPENSLISFIEIMFKSYEFIYALQFIDTTLKTIEL